MRTKTGVLGMKRLVLVLPQMVTSSVYNMRAKTDVGLVERVCSWIGYGLRVCFRTAFFTRSYERTNERTGFGAEEASPRLHFLIYTTTYTFQLLFL